MCLHQGIRPAPTVDKHEGLSWNNPERISAASSLARGEAGYEGAQLSRPRGQPMTLASNESVSIIDFVDSLLGGEWPASEEEAAAYLREHGCEVLVAHQARERMVRVGRWRTAQLDLWGTWTSDPRSGTAVRFCVLEASSTRPDVPARVRLPDRGAARALRCAGDRRPEPAQPAQPLVLRPVDGRGGCRQPRAGTNPHPGDDPARENQPSGPIGSRRSGAVDPERLSA